MKKLPLRFQLMVVTLMAAATLISVPKAEARSALLCPDAVIVSRCNDIPPSLSDACTACGRAVICTEPPQQNYAIAGCEFDQ